MGISPLADKIVFPSTNPLEESDPFDIEHTISTKSEIKIQHDLIGYDQHKSEKLSRGIPLIHQYALGGALY
jgi:hypothetical protein